MQGIHHPRGGTVGGTAIQTVKPNDEFELQLLAGLPVSEEAQRKLFLTGATPPPNSIQVPCYQCGQAMWLGPRQQAMRASSKNSQPVCFGCSVAMQARLGLGPFPVKHLDGESGDYTMTDGQSFPPKP